VGNLVAVLDVGSCNNFCMIYILFPLRRVYGAVNGTLMTVI